MLNRGTTDVIQVSNIAYIQKSGPTTNMQFFLNDVYDDNTSTFAHSLRFAIPAKTGTTQLGKVKLASAPADDLSIADGKFDIPLGKTAN
jgi:hypothetical protein